jgi:hypothetical protein
MLINGNKYRRKKIGTAGSITVESGDTLTVASGGTLTLTGATVTLPTSQALTTPTISGGTVDQAAIEELSESVTGTNVITAAETGKTFYLAGGTDYESTLPTAALGLNFRFVVAAAPTGDTGYTITATPADSINGVIASVPVDDAGIAVTAADNVIFVNDVATVGSWVEFRANATGWFVSGMVNTVEELTANG